MLFFDDCKPEDAHGMLYDYITAQKEEALVCRASTVKHTEMSKSMCIVNDFAYSPWFDIPGEGAV